jgi:hypothetical protein
MSLLILALLQAATPPPARTPPAPPPPPAAPPAFAVGPSDDGGFALTVATLPADKLSEMQDMLDAAAAKRCGARAVVAGEQSYDQSTSSSGLASPTITHLRMTYRCA